MKQYIQNLLEISKVTWKSWMKAGPFRQSAVIAYYAVFSMPALLVIVITCAGFAFGQEAAQGQVSAQVGEILGSENAKQIEQMIITMSQQKGNILATIIGAVTLIFAATGVFAQLQISLNLIWEVEVRAKKQWLKTLRDRLFSFGLIVSMGFLLLISLVISAGLTALGGWIKVHLPDFTVILLRAVNFVISFAVTSTLFSLMFKFLPDVKMRWKDVWIGSFVTTMLFLLGKFALGIYFGKANPGSVYGAAGSIILVMLWVSYSCMIVLLGAEFTKQYALKFGHGIHPAANAVLLSEENDLNPEQEKTKSDDKKIAKENSNR